MGMNKNHFDNFRIVWKNQIKPLEHDKFFRCIIEKLQVDLLKNVNLVGWPCNNL